MFNDRYGLTGAVLRGGKTMTRRLMTMTLHRRNKYWQMVKIMPDNMFIASDGTAHFQVGRNGYMVPKQNQPAYHVGEEVAIAQSYRDAGFMNNPVGQKKKVRKIFEALRSGVGYVRIVTPRYDNSDFDIKILDFREQGQ